MTRSINCKNEKCNQYLNIEEIMRYGHPEGMGFKVACEACKQVNIFSTSELETHIEKTQDKIYQPSHYNQGIETISFIEQTIKDYPPEQAYLVGNTLKYLSRAPHKGSKEEDLKKARNYLNRAIEGEWFKEVKK
ncbi:DUF3310 domain-containing protein [Salinicoccus roseus]|uniref:DUF3310 domain-containing protein n=1 Tax=Salinicoccus roseus TaxID=45670 RepID=A0A265E6D7_9STAP|nr:DUF3310 domain-containing protein [Salinicoccus roseus]OZT77133.1 hypothetical protein CFN03_08640 [Salinicoccus roseus]